MNQSIFDLEQHTEDINRDISAFQNPENTLLFVSSGYESFQLWQQNDAFFLRLRTSTQYGEALLQEERSISKQKAWEVAREILDELEPYRFSLKSSEEGEARLYFNTRQLFCDSRWKDGQWLQWILDILYRCFAFAASLPYPFDYVNPQNGYPVEKKWMAELRYHELKFVLRSPEPDGGVLFPQPSAEANRIGWTLEAETLINRNDNCWHLRESVELPGDTAQELLDWLLECGLLAALVKRAARKPEPVRDYGLTYIHWIKYNTVFRLRTDDLTFEYSDGSKTETDQEEKLMNQAMRHVLDVFDRCRSDEEADK